MRKIVKTLGKYCLAIIGVVFVAFPLLWDLSSSLKPYSEIFSTPPYFVPKTATFEHYQTLLTYTYFPIYFINSIIVAFSTVTVCITIATLAAYTVTRFGFWWTKRYAQLTLFIYMFPRMLLIVPLFVVFSRIGLADTLYGLVLAHTTFAFPFCLWILWAFFSAIPLEIEEAAMIDGCSRLHAFVSVVLPLVRPGIAAAATFTFILSWNDYTMAFFLIHSDKYFTLNRGVAEFIQATHIDWGLIMAASVLITIPVIIAYIFVSKQLVKGFSVGVLK